MSKVLSLREAGRGRFATIRPGIAADLMRATDNRIVVAGPVGTGKSKIILEKIRACCIQYPGCRWLFLRSVRKWLTHSILVTWEEKVIEPEHLVPDKINRGNRSEYKFKNGSRVVIAGLDDPQAVFSAEYDGAFINEATEIDLDTVEKVDGRLRYGRMPFQQLLMDCNPGPPSHWIYQSFQNGYVRRMQMLHKDNPVLYLPDGRITRFGKEYLGRLQQMTGVRKDRYLFGRWVQAEGVVYDNWNPSIHVIEPFPIPSHWRRWHAVDFGFTNPLVWQFWAEDPDGRIYLYREIYKTKQYVIETAKWVKRIMLEHGDPRPEAIITDHDPEAQGHIHQVLDIRPTPADKSDRVGGIQDVANRLRVAEDGKPRLFVFRGALIHTLDADLVQAGKPTRTEMEFDSYVWNPKLKHGEEPLKEGDHGMDSCRYLARHLNAKAQLGKFDGYGVPDEPSGLPDDTWR